MKVREFGRVLSKAVLVVTGGCETGEREVAGVTVATGEMEGCWKAFLASLVDRRLHGVQMGDLGRPPGAGESDSRLAERDGVAAEVHRALRAERAGAGAQDGAGAGGGDVPDGVHAADEGGRGGALREGRGWYRGATRRRPGAPCADAARRATEGAAWSSAAATPPSSLAQMPVTPPSAGILTNLRPHGTSHRQRLREVDHPHYKEECLLLRTGNRPTCSTWRSRPGGYPPRPLTLTVPSPGGRPWKNGASSRPGRKPLLALPQVLYESKFRLGIEPGAFPHGYPRSTEFSADLCAWCFPGGSSKIGLERLPAPGMRRLLSYYEVPEAVTAAWASDRCS